MRSAAVGHQCPDCVKEGSKSARPIKAAYGGRARSAPYVTRTLLGVNVLMLLLTTSGAGLVQGNTDNALFRRLALIPTAIGFRDADGGVDVVNGVAQGEYYRLLTSTFLHFGVLHLALNMYCLYLLGPQLEQAFGQLRYAATYLLSGLGGAALSYGLGNPSEVAAGASGAVFGLFGAFYVVSRRRNLDVSAITGTIVMNLVFSFVVPSVDWRGHIGGLITGAALAWVLVYSPDTKQRDLYQAAGVLVVALLIVAGVAARTAQLT